MSTPQISVILSAYNAAAPLRAAVASIRQQTFEDWELVLVDDGSDDEARDEMVRIAAEDRRIRLLHNDVNLGLSASLNRGWRSARGELIARMDADDVCMPERFERQFALLRARSAIAVVGSGATLIDPDGTVRGMWRPAEEHEQIVAQILHRLPFVHPSVMMRRSFLDRLGGYDARLRRAQDYDLWLRGARRFRYHNLPEPLLLYTQPGRLSGLALLYGSRVLLSGGFRLNRPVAGAFHAARFLVGGLGRSILGTAGPLSA